MVQNQINQKLMHNEIFQENKGCLPIQCALRRRSNLGFHHHSNEKNGHNNISEITEHNKIENRHDYNFMTLEQRSRQADQHEHPYECENSPWRRQQNEVIGQANGTYTNRY